MGKILLVSISLLLAGSSLQAMEQDQDKKEQRLKCSLKRMQWRSKLVMPPPPHHDENSPVEQKKETFSLRQKVQKYLKWRSRR